MSKAMQRIQELSDGLATIYAVRDRADTLAKALVAERAEFLATEHRRKARKRKWLWMASNVRWKSGKGPKYGDRMKVSYTKRRGYCEIVWRGRGYSIPWSAISLSKPSRGISNANRLLASILG